MKKVDGNRRAVLRKRSFNVPTLKILVRSISAEAEPCLLEAPEQNPNLKMLIKQDSEGTTNCGTPNSLKSIIFENLFFFYIFGQTFSKTGNLSNIISKNLPKIFKSHTIIWKPFDNTPVKSTPGPNPGGFWLVFLNFFRSH